MIKQVGTAANVIGALLLSAGASYAVIGYSIFILGSVCWGWVGYKVKDTALLTLNVFFVVCNFIGIYNYGIV